MTGIWDVWRRLAVSPSGGFRYAYENSALIVLVLNPLVPFAAAGRLFGDPTSADQWLLRDLTFAGLGLAAGIAVGTVVALQLALPAPTARILAAVGGSVLGSLLALGVGAMFSNEPATLRDATAEVSAPDLCPAPSTAGGDQSAETNNDAGNTAGS